MAENRYGTGPEASSVSDSAQGSTGSVGSDKKKSGGGADKRETPSGYKRSGYKRSGTQHCEEE